MRIIDIMSQDLIVPALQATTRDDALRELVSHIVRVHQEIDADLAIRVLIERERLGSTGVGHGLAIPHAKLPTITGAIACFARSVHGVSFGSLDGSPTHLFLTILAPVGQPGLHLKCLARASRLFKEKDFRAQLMKEPGTPATLWAAIREQDVRLASLEC